MPHPTVIPSRQPAPQEQQPPWIRRLMGLGGVALTLAWGFAEGTLFFVVPDVAISLAALLEPRRTWRHILAATAGTLGAAMLLFVWSSRQPSTARCVVARVPFVTTRMFAEVHARFCAEGSAALFFGPLSGIPYKIYSVEAPEFSSARMFLLCTGPARMERFLIVWTGFALAGRLLRQSRGWSARQLAALHGALWVVFYSAYWSWIAFR